MFYCDKATSVLFPPIDKVIQVYNCCITDLVSCPFYPKNKSRKTQKSIKCKNNCVGPTSHFESVCTDTNGEVSTNNTLDETCPNSCTEDFTTLKPRFNKKSKIYGTTQHRDDPVQMKNTKKIYSRKKRSQGTRKDTGDQRKKGKKVNLKTVKEGSMPTKLVNTKQSTLDKKSLISLYRKRKKKKTGTEETCNCPFDEEFEMKPPNENGLYEQIIEEKTNKDHLTDKTCKKGLCSQAMKLKDKDFVCSCVDKKVPKSPAVRCTNTTCRKENIMSKKSSLTKISEVFRKVKKHGRNVKIDLNDICEEGVCKDAYYQDNQDICCKCKLKVRKCTDTTCTPSKNKPKVNNSSESQSFLQKICYVLRSKKGLRHSAKKHMRENIIVQNEIEQTGEPLFEIKVNAMDMSVLNPSEIKDKVMLLGQKKKRDECVCLSHATGKQYILEKKECLDGLCHKSFKNKRTDFNCKCLKNKVWTCTDSTCNKAVTFVNDNKYSPRAQNSLKVSENDEPLVEMQVDSNSMSIINTNEMKNKMEYVKRQSNKLCPTGICKEKSKDRNARIVCNCKKDAKHKECAEDTCNITEQCCRCRKPRNNKMARRSLDTASLKNVTSKFSGFCNRMFCKSDNRVNWQKNKSQRDIRRRRSTLHTQSNNVRKRQGLKIMIKQHDVTPNKTNGNECGENCCTCDNDYTNKQITKESVGDNVKAKIFGKIKLSKKSQVSKENIGDNVKTKNTAKPEKITRKVHQRNGVQVPVPSSKLAKKSSMIVKKKIKAICKCHHNCECSLEEHRRRIQAIRRQKGSNSKKKKKSDLKSKKWEKESAEKRKHFAKEREQIMKEEEKRHIQQKKEEMEVLKLLESDKGAGRTNCCVEIFGAVVSVGILPVKILIRGLFKAVTDPKGSYLFTSERLKDPQGTYVMIKKAVRDGWRIRKLKVTKCMRNSETVSVLSDTIKETPLYQTFADKGKTQREQEKTKLETKQRRKRIRQRHDAALYGCRHMLLTTLRKTPCLWVYHVCPEFYPQCLSCLAFTRNFWHMCLFMLALACWTPCIVACELMRGLCCCLLCTG